MQIDDNINYGWIKIDSIDEYKSAASALKTLANNQNMSVAQWEP